MPLKEKIQTFMNNNHKTAYVFIASQEMINLLSGAKGLKLSSSLDPKLVDFYELRLGRVDYYVKEILNKNYFLVKKEFFSDVLMTIKEAKDVPTEFGLVYLDTQYPLDVLLKKEDELTLIEPPSQSVIPEPSSGSFIKQSDLEEESIELSKKFKKHEKIRLKSFSWRSCFFSPDELFSNFLLLEGQKIAEKIIKEHDNKKENLNPLSSDISKPQEKKDLLDLVPTPEEKYQELIKKPCKSLQRAKYFNANFPFSLVRELNNSHHFWFSISTQYKKVDDFAIQLKNYYSSLNPRQLEQLISKRETNNELDANLWSNLQKNVILQKYDGQDSSFKQLLDRKINELNSKNNDLSAYLVDLKEKLFVKGKSPESDLLYLQTMKEKKGILEDIEKTMRLLEEYSSRIQKFSSLSNFDAKFYLTIFGSNAILSQYDWQVGNTLFELNDQINEIIYYQQEIERVLFEKLSILHKARKAELKLEFLSQDQELSKLIYQQKEKEQKLKRTDQLKELEIKGSLEISKYNIQKQIDQEKNKLSKYLDRLKRLDSYADYEDRSRSLREKGDIFREKVDKYREEIYAMKLKVERIENQYASFISTLRGEVQDFQNSISTSYASHLSLMNNAMSKVWKDWALQGIEYIEKIISRKEKLIREFSEIIVLNLKRMYLNQENLFQESKTREKEWERVYNEMVDEFKTLGYFLSKPKPSESYYRFLPKMEKSHLSLSPEIEKLIYYKPSLKYTIPKINELIGLSPKLLNDEDFLVIDQVWAKLTPLQEYRLKKKVEKESKEKNKKRIEELIKQSKNDMNKRLEEKNYKFKTLTFENNFPQEADEEERIKKLKLFEKSQFHNWKEANFTTSEVRYKFKDMLSNLTQKVMTLKGVEVWGNRLNISDKGELENPDLVERLGEWDYFIKSKEKLSFIESCGLSSFKLDESETFSLEDESYLSILEALEERDKEIKEKKASIKLNKPTIDDWLNLNLKRYREEKKKIDIVEVKEGLLELEKEIETLKKASGNYKEACEIEKTKREILCEEMKDDLEDLQKYLDGKSKELEEIFMELQGMMDYTFEDISKKLAERRKNIVEIKLEKESST
ncbi:hypothetical protein [Mycoplasma parvum]|uniref:Uncharacterized protein n=1 Tax=Mycoplasma parvum str. Indiana TaxID=1403316 RepID=U5NFS6_9MOLU|nr:hypothetical protein [Mycoplasma parvum]AGX89103.1 hypothetical protein PRV_01810 [Mycoplasma parvum str. Indiana]